MQRDEVRSLADCERYAQLHGYDSVKFRITNGVVNSDIIFRWGDAYMGFVFIDGKEESGFLKVDTLRDAAGPNAVCVIVD